MQLELPVIVDGRVGRLPEPVSPDAEPKSTQTAPASTILVAFTTKSSKGPPIARSS